MIVVVDYGMGNLRSVSKAIEHLDARVKVSDQPNDIRRADKLVLPGVGAFGDAARELGFRHLTDPVREFALSGKPFLGICLGLQLLFDESEESPGVRGLGVIAGKVRKFKTQTAKIPHMGWNQLDIDREVPILKGIEPASYFYFVHTYCGVPEDPSWTVGSCDYDGERFCAVAGRDQMFATQFHPEKSQQAGLKILQNFIGL